MLAGRLFLSLFLISSLAGSLAWSQAPEAACARKFVKLAELQATLPGPRLFLPAEKSGLREFDSIQELKIGQFNVENMYNYRGRWRTDPATGARTLEMPPEPKPQARWRQLQEVILRSDDDIMVWEEVEDIAAAQDFVNTKLGGRYRVLLVEGNDERGIDIAVVVKKDLPFDLELQSHKYLTYDRNGNRQKVFSRDLPVVTIRRAGAPPGERPLARLAGTHYKSQQDSRGDPGSILKRTRQVEATAKLLADYEKKDPAVPIFLMGDFNSDVRSGPEFESLWRAGFKDSFDLSPEPLPKEKRVTQSFFPKEGAPTYSQLDAVLVNRAGHENIVKGARIQPFRNSDGSPMPLPRSIKERSSQGSDHLKLQIILDFKKMRDNWRHGAGIHPQLLRPVFGDKCLNCEMALR